MKRREKNNKKIDIKMDPFPILRGKGSLPFASLQILGSSMQFHKMLFSTQ